MTKSEKFASIENGKIIAYTDGFPAHELKTDQIPLTSNEYWLLKSVNGDLELAKAIVRDLEQRIKKLSIPKIGKCICTQLWEFPNVPNPDCPVHGSLPPVTIDQMRQTGGS